MGTVMHFLWETSSTIEDPQGILNRPTNRISDIPLSTALPPDIFLMLRTQLTSRNLYWVGDIANRKGNDLFTQPLEALREHHGGTHSYITP